MSHGPVVSAAGFEPASAGGAISSRRQRERFAAAAHSVRTTSAHATPITSTIHAADRSASPARTATSSRNDSLDDEPRHRWAARERRRHGGHPVGERPRSGVRKPSLGRPVLVLVACGSGSLGADRLQLGAQLGRDRLELAHAIGEGREGLLDSCWVVPLLGVRQLVGLRQLLIPLKYAAGAKKPAQSRRLSQSRPRSRASRRVPAAPCRGSRAAVPRSSGGRSTSLTG